MTLPNWYGLVLLGLAAFRTWRLLGEDVILEKPRAWLVYGFRKWRGDRSAEYVEEFITCPWCLGFWVAIAWWGAFQIWEKGTLIAAIPFAAATIVALLGRISD